MQCLRFSNIDLNGEKVFKAKKAYDTQEEAITDAKVLNLRPNQITKLVPYRCKDCHKFHLGRNGKPITEKDKKRLLRQL